LREQKGNGRIERKKDEGKHKEGRLRSSPKQRRREWSSMGGGNGGRETTPNVHSTEIKEGENTTPIANRYQSHRGKEKACLCPDGYDFHSQKREQEIGLRRRCRVVFFGLEKIKVPEGIKNRPIIIPKREKETVGGKGGPKLNKRLILKKRGSNR